MAQKAQERRQDRLRQLHDDLLATMLRFQQDLPRDTQGITEEVERHARVISLMIRTMNMICEREESFKTATNEVRSREDIVKEIEHIFNSILAENETAELPKPTQ